MNIAFPWETLEAIIGGRSAIDVPVLQVADLNQAQQFLMSYGFDWTVEADRQAAEKVRREAVAFLEEELLASEPDLVIDPAVRDETDVRQLLVLASASERGARQKWACALLRVAHTVNHAASPLGDLFHAQIREQILDRFEPHVHRASDGTLSLGEGEEAVPLAQFDVRPVKSLRSIVMKLLHKAENVAADVFDRVGVRLVTRKRFDALLAIRYLRENHVIMFVNVKASRSRNSLVDLPALQRELEALNADMPPGEVPYPTRLARIRERVDAMPFPKAPRVSANPHSSIGYHAIQFTCRQLITAHADHFHQPIRFFFPYEVQIMDQACYESSRSGLANHDDYRERQRETVKQRVLRDLLPPGS